MDRLQTMKTFVRVVDEGGFAAAARALEVDQALVTRQVANLERHLGVKLLERTTRSMRLTEAGETFLGRCRDILSDVAEAEAMVSRSHQDMVGRVRLSLPTVFGMEVTAQQLTRLHEEFPDITVEMAMLDRAVDPVAEGFDVVTMNATLGVSATAVARPMLEVPLLLCAAPRYLQRHPPPQRGVVPPRPAPTRPDPSRFTGHPPMVTRRRVQYNTVPVKSLTGSVMPESVRRGWAVTGNQPLPKSSWTTGRRVREGPAAGADEKGTCWRLLRLSTSLSQDGGVGLSHHAYLHQPVEIWVGMRGSVGCETVLLVEASSPHVVLGHPQLRRPRAERLVQESLTNTATVVAGQHVERVQLLVADLRVALVLSGRTSHHKPDNPPLAAGDVNPLPASLR